jgi:deoxyribose-phosphate aldolase
MKANTSIAQQALACLDLTSLNDADTAADIERLCARAAGPCGAVAAVCVLPRLAAEGGEAA